MAVDLNPRDPLSQVVFIHDYIQLVFQDNSFSLYNECFIDSNGTRFVQGRSGFADLLVSQLERLAVIIPDKDPAETCLSLQFEGGAIFSVGRGGAARGPEAWQFKGPGNLIVVEQNE